MKTLRVPFLFLSVLVLIGSGCKGLENTADRPSPYNGDEVLYRAELITTTSYDSMRDFVTWEKQWRPIINNRDVKHAADTVRAHGKEWISTAKRLRDSYKISPTQANKDALNASLDVISQALAEALGYMSKYTTTKKV